MDPLAALRDYETPGELDKIVRVGDEFRFAFDFSFLCNAETAFRSKQGNLYTLETLLFYVHNHQLKHTDYLQATRARKIPTVTLPDRKPLHDYLLGRIASSDSIETLLLPSVKPPGAADQEYQPEEPPTLLAGPAADETELPVSIANDHVERLDYTSMIKALERPLKDRETRERRETRETGGRHDDERRRRREAVGTAMREARRRETSSQMGGNGGKRASAKRSAKCEKREASSRKALDSRFWSESAFLCL